MFDDFPKAIAEPRGCGDREEGGVYAECGPSPYGSPLEHFLFDPPLPLPDGLDLVNKPGHARFGEGIVLRSEIVEGTTFVEVQFKATIGKKRLSMDFDRLERV
jgi:hypothetical protein